MEEKIENNLNFALECIGENVTAQHLVLENAHRKNTDVASNYDELIKKNRSLILEYQQLTKYHSITPITTTLAKMRKMKENLSIISECKENLMMTVKTLQFDKYQARLRFFEKIAAMEEKLEKTVQQFSGTTIETEMMKTTAELNKVQEVLMQLNKDYDGIIDTAENFNDYRLNELNYEMRDIDFKKRSHIKRLEHKKSNINRLEFEICTMEETLNKIVRKLFQKRML